MTGNMFTRFTRRGFSCAEEEVSRATTNVTHCLSFVFEVYRCNYEPRLFRHWLIFGPDLPPSSNGLRRWVAFGKVYGLDHFLVSGGLSQLRPSLPPIQTCPGKILATILGSAFRRPVSGNLLPRRNCAIRKTHVRYAWVPHLSYAYN